MFEQGKLINIQTKLGPSWGTSFPALVIRAANGVMTRTQTEDTWCCWAQEQGGGGSQAETAAYNPKSIYFQAFDVVVTELVNLVTNTFIVY